MLPVFVKPRIEKVGRDTPVLFYFDIQRVKRLSIKFFNRDSIEERSPVQKPVYKISARSKEVLVSLFARFCYIFSSQ